MRQFGIKQILTALAAVLAVLTAFGGGLLLGTNQTSAVSQPTAVDFAPFWKAWQIIDEKYVPGANSTTTKTVTDQDRVWGAISGMVEALDDPYSNFLPPSAKKLFEQEIRGNFGGVGMEVGIRDGVLTVIAPLTGSPAKRAGIKAGDKIVVIDETPAGKLSVSEAIELIRGKIGTTVNLKVSRDGKQFDFKVVRENINIPTLDTQMLPQGIFLIRLYNFSAPAANLFRNALRQFVEAKTDKLIIDLRGNPGGYLDGAVDIASWFLPTGQPVAIEDYGGNETQKIYRSRGYDIFNDRLKLVILVDGGSASASEILAGALLEPGLATLVGEQTFGKGSVQELVPVTDDSSLKITVARWLTPKGISISHNGLTPDVVVKSKEGTNHNSELEVATDPQLAKAVEILLKK
ncbi:MAG: S41 family peptidase [Candidatus Vogelbacteria bacterium]|nr:S41 family peptidase [Candidatus Vogelbacteria bacterium]